jgi:hypothetical protein
MTDAGPLPPPFTPPDNRVSPSGPFLPLDGCTRQISVDSVREEITIDAPVGAVPWIARRPPATPAVVEEPIDCSLVDFQEGNVLMLDWTINLSNELGTGTVPVITVPWLQAGDQLEPVDDTTTGIIGNPGNYLAVTSDVPGDPDGEFLLLSGRTMVPIEGEAWERLTSKGDIHVRWLVVVEFPLVVAGQFDAGSFSDVPNGGAFFQASELRRQCFAQAPSNAPLFFSPAP